MKRILLLYMSIAAGLCGFSLTGNAQTDESDDSNTTLFLWWLGSLIGDLDSSNSDIEEEYFIYYQKVDSILEMADWRDSIFKENLDKNGKILHHVVEKGEDWESIADDYKISQLDLMWANPFEEDCYAGLELSIPALLSEEELREFQLTVKNAYYIEGKRQYDKGDYSKAKKTYDKIIESPYTSLLAYYNRGMSQYRNGKLREAMSDFTHVIANDPQQRFPDVKELRARAEKLQAERDQERAEGIASFIGLASNIAITAFQISQSNSNSSYNPESSTSGYTFSSNDDDYSSENSSTTVKSRKVCRTCKGDGKCIGCHGSGYRTDNQFGTGVDPSHTCGVCGGKGTCGVCDGTGYQS